MLVAYESEWRVHLLNIYIGVFVEKWEIIALISWFKRMLFVSYSRYSNYFLD